MRVLDIQNYDIVNYKDPSMFIATPVCSFKCNQDANDCVCQNYKLMGERVIILNDDTICQLYLTNPLTKAIVIGGLEPLDTEDEVLKFIHCLRDDFKCNAPVIIYTGYTESEAITGWRDEHGADRTENHIHWWHELKKIPNIIVKFGRYKPNQEPHFDPILGVNLASDNQYAKIISEME